MDYSPQHPEWSRFSHNSHLDLSLLHAYQRQQGYPRHSHDYYVIAVVEQGVQGFQFGAGRYTTPAGGFILLNPGETHTGEPVDRRGYRYRALYPQERHLQAILGKPGASAPRFASPRAEHPALARQFLQLHDALLAEDDPLATQALFTETLAALMRQFARAAQPSEGDEPRAVRRALDYIHSHVTGKFSLADLADYAGLSRYHLLRVFRAEVGMPPHTYLETLRVRRSQQLIAEGQSLADIALEVGFSSQSHFNRHFKRILGVTPGRYAQELAH